MCCNPADNQASPTSSCARHGSVAPAGAGRAAMHAKHGLCLKVCRHCGVGPGDLPRRFSFRSLRVAPTGPAGAAGALKKTLLG